MTQTLYISIPMGFEFILPKPTFREVLPGGMVYLELPHSTAIESFLKSINNADQN